MISTRSRDRKRLRVHLQIATIVTRLVGSRSREKARLGKNRDRLSDLITSKVQWTRRNLDSKAMRYPMASSNMIPDITEGTLRRHLHDRTSSVLCAFAE